MSKQTGNCCSLPCEGRLPSSQERSSTSPQRSGKGAGQDAGVGVRERTALSPCDCPLPAALASLPSSPVFAVSPASSRVPLCFPSLSLLSPHYTLFSFHGPGSFHGLVPQPRELPRACVFPASHLGLPSPSSPPLLLSPGALVQLPESETGEHMRLLSFFPLPDHQQTH